MTFFQRATAFVAVSFCVASLATSSPGIAAEMDRGSLNARALGAPDFYTPLNAADTDTVPAPVDGETPEVPGVTVQQLPAAPAPRDTTDAYASLADAVASQAVPDTIDENLRCLAGAIYFESKGEPLSGQLAVADVILNRSKSGRFPSSICSVVTQPGQFSFVRHGDVPAISPERSAYHTALAVAQVALNAAWSSPASGALYFHARRVKPGWGLTQVASIGHHVFFR